MSVFGNYARYYDLLYRDKDYKGEAEYVDGLLRRALGESRFRVLELGCGTGKHAALLADNGYTVCGIDRSAEMLRQASSRIKPGGAQTLEFKQGDICGVDLEREFDAVISLFHVVSYITGTADLRRLFHVARNHLRAGGVFVFDCWYGPAVLMQRPETRVLRLEDDDVSIVRLAEPTLRVNECRVDVDYEIMIHDKISGRHETVRETHEMRYLFKPEIDLLSGDAGMDVAQAEEWMTGRPLGSETWGACFVARA